MPTSNNEEQAVEARERSIHDITAVTGSLGVTGITWGINLEGAAQVIMETGSITLTAGSIIVSTVVATRKHLQKEHSQQ